MNTKVVGSKTMVVILTPLPGLKEVTCLHPTKQYSNEIGNLGMIHVLVVFVMRFFYSVLYRYSVITLCNEINCLYKFKLTISNLPTSTAVRGMVT